MVEFRTVRVRSHLFPRWWRNPIAWWKLRRLRSDLRFIRRLHEQDPTLGAAVHDFERRIDDAMINGTGDV